MEFCYWCNHYTSNGAFGGGCTKHQKGVLMWDRCPDYDSENHEPGMCPTSRTCICTVYSHTCEGTMEEYLKRGCGKPKDIFSLTDQQNEQLGKALVDFLNTSYDNLMEMAKKKIEEKKDE